MLYEYSRSQMRRYLYSDCLKGLNFEDHMHSSFELIVVTKGEVSATLSGKTYCLESGDAMLIMPHRIHKFSSNEDSECITVIFSTDYVKEFYAVMRDCDWKKTVFSNVDWQMFLGLDQEKPFYCMGVLYTVCAIALENCQPVASNWRDDLLTRKIIDYIHEHYTSDISLETLAEELSYNYCYLSDFINQTFGAGFPMLLAGYRVDLALTLLHTTDLSITEIAGKCGYSTTRSFHRAFRKITGKSPRELREIS